MHCGSLIKPLQSYKASFFFSTITARYYPPSSLYSFTNKRLRTYSTAIPQSTTSKMSETTGFYSLKAERPNGQIYDFADLKGKTVLIVNVASKCGSTPQYKGLQALYDKYKGQGLEILGFPCSQFANQEPADDEGIQEFCTLNYGVTFPLMKKSEVNGDNSNEVYQWLKSQKSGLLGLTRIKWNFEKFLVDSQGNVVNRWATTTTPEAIDSTIASLVSKPTTSDEGKL
ncbi:thioredoxin-like protein [Crepidotus variabilis]|uniref:Glutathione peroxidase n=1 Tax=Crepidotus variabilis TaxID=179855 RepID=A0A9P6JVW3_9AGAR|nr:thioredoxin-like protein [Crepidotus variabilis]